MKKHLNHNKIQMILFDAPSLSEKQLSMTGHYYSRVSDPQEGSGVSQVLCFAVCQNKKNRKTDSKSHESSLK